MSFRTNPDRILDGIDRSRSRSDDRDADLSARDATARDLDTTTPPTSATLTDRSRRILSILERAYTSVASGSEIKKLASRFQAVGDISRHHARGDIIVSIQYLEHPRPDDLGVVPFEIRPEDIEEMRISTGHSRADGNALRVLRLKLREGVIAAWQKLEPRVRDAIGERAEMGHVAVQVTVDLRSAA